MLLHTADWHLGKVLDGVSLLDDQRDWFSRFCDDLSARKPQVILICGDLFDYNGCTPQAKTLFDEIMTRLLSECGCPVLAIPGNHDRFSWLKACCAPYRDKGLFLAERLDDAFLPFPFVLDGKRVQFFLIPYFTSALQRQAGGGTPEACMKRVIERIEAVWDESALHIAAAHGLILQRDDPAVKRLLSENHDGGAQLIDAALFSRFDYAALGHIHATSPVSERCCYAGTPMVYERKELRQEKGYLSVDFSGDTPKTARHSLPPMRPVVEYTGAFSSLIASPPQHIQDAYLYLNLTDSVLQADGFARLKRVFPHLLQMRYPLPEETEPLPLDTMSQRMEDFLAINGVCLTEAQRHILRAAEEMNSGTLKK